MQASTRKLHVKWNPKKSRKPVTEKHLLHYFTVFGDLCHVDRPLDKRDQKVPFCFIIFSTLEQAQNCLKCADHKLKTGTTLVVQSSSYKEDEEQMTEVLFSQNDLKELSEDEEMEEEEVEEVAGEVEETGKIKPLMPIMANEETEKNGEADSNDRIIPPLIQPPVEGGSEELGVKSRKVFMKWDRKLFPSVTSFELNVFFSSFGEFDKFDRDFHGTRKGLRRDEQVPYCQITFKRLADANAVVKPGSWTTPEGTVINVYESKTPDELPEDAQCRKMKYRTAAKRGLIRPEDREEHEREERKRISLWRVQRGERPWCHEDTEPGDYFLEDSDSLTARPAFADGYEAAIRMKHQGRNPYGPPPYGPPPYGPPPYGPPPYGAPDDPYAPYASVPPHAHDPYSRVPPRPNHAPVPPASYAAAPRSAAGAPKDPSIPWTPVDPLDSLDTDAFEKDLEATATAYAAGFKDAMRKLKEEFAALNSLETYPEPEFPARGHFRGRGHVPGRGHIPGQFRGRGHFRGRGQIAIRGISSRGSYY